MARDRQHPTLFLNHAAHLQSPDVPNKYAVRSALTPSSPPPVLRLVCPNLSIQRNKYRQPPSVVQAYSLKSLAFWIMEQLLYPATPLHQPEPVIAQGRRPSRPHIRLCKLNFAWFLYRALNIRDYPPAPKPSMVTTYWKTSAGMGERPWPPILNPS